MSRLLEWLTRSCRSNSDHHASMASVPSAEEHTTRRQPAPIDLTEDWSLTFALLDDTRLWRERAVHEIVLGDSDHVNVETRYQVRMPLELLQTFDASIRSGDLVRLLLPFTIRPNDLLLNVKMTGPVSTSASLVLRQESAEIQAEYVAHVDGKPLGEQPLGGALWVGISAYTTSAWHEHLALEKPSRWRQLLPSYELQWRIRALVAYLNADLALDIEARHVAEWIDRIEPTRLALIEALGEGADPDSSSECILLAIPFMPFRPQRIADIDILVAEFSDAVAAMNTRTRQVVAEYGRRWEAIVETVVPVGGACSIKLSEQRPWVNTPSPVMEQQIAFGDATTTHVEVRAADHGVVIDRPRISNLAGDRVGFAVGDAMRETADAVAVYASDPNRPYLARISVRAAARRGQRAIIMWLLALIAIAGVATVTLPEAPSLAESLALLIFPLTLAGAVVLTREATSLAERLLRRWRVALAAAIAALWFVTLSRLLLNADVGWAESAWHGVRDLVDL